ncbi:MAG: bifunctional nuclease family protein [Methanosarcinaceae archaeon]|nr:bifunctional nuclease family protein [Methanosarcinaceae archaeon]
MKSDKDIKQVHVKGVYMIETLGRHSPAILLEDNVGLLMPIYIGHPEAFSINAVLKNETMPRPMTHDLVVSMLTRLGVEIEMVLIDDNIDNIYYARLLLKKDGSIMEFDARPSDCIALALRNGAPIMIRDKVLRGAVIEKEKLVGARVINGFV